MTLVSWIRTMNTNNLKINAWITQNDKKMLLERVDITPNKINSKNELNTIEIDSTKKYQQIDGFGAALTESSAYLFSKLDKTRRIELLKDLFTELGIDINLIRITVGASDFSLSSFTYDDITPGEEDLKLEHFTIEKDYVYLIPMLKEILSLKKDIQIVSSPWSAPAWMKNTKHVHGGSLEKKYFDVYANYLDKYIEAYQKEGINIYAITPQNEPMHEVDTYPTMTMSKEDQLEFVVKLKEVFNKNKRTTGIISYDHNWDEPEYPKSILDDPKGYNAVIGSGFHCYAGHVSAQNKVHEAHPEKGIWFTECSGGAWATNFSDNITWNMENVFMGSLNNYSKSVLMWNLALDDHHGPTNGGCMNCRGVLTVHEDGTYTKNEEYYFIGHFSKFVKKGAYRIDTKASNPNLLVTSFINPDQSKVVVVHNKAGEEITFDLIIDGINTTLSINNKTTISYVIK